MPKGHRGVGKLVGTSATSSISAVYTVKDGYNLNRQGTWLGTQLNPVSNAAALVAAGMATSGLYYVSLPTVGTTQTYCDLSTQGGGWMLAMRLDSTLGTGTVHHYYDPTWWENATSYSAAPTSARTTGEVKTAVYGYYPHTQVMLEYGYGATAWANSAVATYSQPGAGGSAAHQNTTLAYKQATTTAYHENGGRTWNGLTTDKYRWTKTASTDNTYFPNAYLHINVGTDVSSGVSGAASNDTFRFWFNSISDTVAAADACNQIGGWGMTGDYAYSGGTPQNQSVAYSTPNASATISPPSTTTSGFGCQWNSLKASAGSSGKDFLGNTTTQVSSTYYNNGVGLIWVK